MHKFRLLGLAILSAFFVGWAAPAAYAQDLLIPMDARQSDHLKAYGAAYWTLKQGQTVEWLLNYRGGSFLTSHTPSVERELRIRGVSYETLSSAEAARILAEVDREDSNTNAVRLETPPRIAIYAPEQTLPWDDAVLLALTFAEVPYDRIYDREVLAGELSKYDWLHVHHEDFTGQYGKFYAQYRNAPWYIEQVRTSEQMARELGFRKVSDLKLAVAKAIRDYTYNGGFLFAMCSAPETLDVTLAAHATDIVPAEFDGDPVDPNALEMLDYDMAFAFHNFRPNLNPLEYEHSDIDVMPPPHLQDPTLDYFTLFEFSAKWDPVPTMLTQNHVATIKGFMGQTTNFRKSLIKPSTVILAESPGRDEVRYVHGTLGQGTFTFYGGHDPEDYKHFVGDPPTDLNLHRNSPGYRLILNNILFPAAKQEPKKT